VRLLGEVREIQARVHAEALELLREKLREGRWYPRRHMRLGLYLIAAIALLLLLLNVFQSVRG
jgi:hypothetical protein